MKLLRDLFSGLSLMMVVFLFHQTIVDYGNEVWYWSWGVMAVVGSIAAWLDEKVGEKKKKVNQQKP